MVMFRSDAVSRIVEGPLLDMMKMLGIPKADVGSRDTNVRDLDAWAINH